MTRVPMGPTLFNSGAMSVNPALYKEDTYAAWDMPTTMNMGLTAEKLAYMEGLGREEMDHWAVRSHERAAAAIESGFFVITSYSIHYTKLYDPTRTTALAPSSL